LSAFLSLSINIAAYVKENWRNGATPTSYNYSQLYSYFNGTTSFCTLGNVTISWDVGAAPSTRLVVEEETGMVGIGTGAPSQPLDVDGQVRLRTLPVGAAVDNIVTADANGNLRQRSAADVVAASGTDGSETIINAGTNVTVTGTGTTASPYEINSSFTDTDDQLLSIDGDSLRIEDGNAIALDSLGSDNQALRIDGDSLRIEDGNAIALDGLGSDNQALSILDDSLRIYNGNSVPLYWVERQGSTLGSNLFTSSMTATQSSIYGNNEPGYGAPRAINGNTASSDRSLTRLDYPHPWWKLDMGANVTLNRLRFYQYSSSQSRLSDFWIILSETDINLPVSPSASDVSALTSNPAYTVIDNPGQIASPFEDILFGETTARYMILVKKITGSGTTNHYLQIAEIEAYNVGLESLATANSSLNVGVGTTTPSEKLEVVGTIKATDINFTGLPVFADEAAAITGGLQTGDLYRTATGEIRIKL
jgi:hypothetical protein